MHPLFASVLLLASPAGATFTQPILKDASNEPYCPESTLGQACRMTFARAKEYCGSRHAGLPTVRDFARWSGSHGARGILEAGVVESQLGGRAPEGYYLVASVEESGLADRFYFSHEGFVRPADGPAVDSYWTASTAAQHPDYAHVFYTAHGGGGGKPEEHRKSFPNAVVCLR